jgi:hypothetical protein
MRIRGKGMLVIHHHLNDGNLLPRDLQKVNVDASFGEVPDRLA